MKKKYMQPSIEVLSLHTFIHLLANSFDGSSLSIDPSKMEDGDGSDAVKANSVWDDDWSDN